MADIKFNVLNQKIIRTDDFAVVADSRNYLKAEFSFSEEWTSPITAVFGYDNKFVSVLLEKGRCTVPWEVIKAPFFTVSVFCGDRITANTVKVDVEGSGYKEGETAREPSPDIYTQLIALCGEARDIAKSVRDDADSGAFAGEQGIQGEAGYTPQKGIDYAKEMELIYSTTLTEDASLLLITQDNNGNSFELTEVMLVGDYRNLETVSYKFSYPRVQPNNLTGQSNYRLGYYNDNMNSKGYKGYKVFHLKKQGAFGYVPFMCDMLSYGTTPNTVQVLGQGNAQLHVKDAEYFTGIGAEGFIAGCTIYIYGVRR